MTYRHKFTSEELWIRYINILIQQLNSKPTIHRVSYLSSLPYFFEDWLKGECVFAADLAFKNMGYKVYINETFHEIKKLDLGFEIQSELLAVELKYIPTTSKNAKSRFYGPKNSNVVKDYHKLQIANKSVGVSKLLFLYGPAQLKHDEKEICCQSRDLSKTCLVCAMKELEKRINVGNIQYKIYTLLNDELHIVEVDINKKGR